MANGRFITKNLTLTVDTGETGVIDTANDRAVGDVSDLTGISIYVNQLVDAGTATFTIEKSIDGINYATVGTIADTDFTLGANKAEELALSDSNGMPLSTKLVRVTATALTGGGKYSVSVAGTQRDGYR